MWECKYGRETVDYRLLWLRFLRKVWILPLAVLAGVALVGACHFYARTAARGGRTYQTESIFYIDFGKNDQGKEYDYYNYYTWGEVIHTDFFLDSAQEKMGASLSREEIEAYVSATVDSDPRYLYVRCDTHSPELSVRLAAAMEEIVPEFADARKELQSIEVVKRGETAKDSSKLRIGNAFLLGGGLGFGTALFGILILLVMDPAVYLPSTLEKRYSILCLGAPFMPEFAPNWRHVLKGASTVAMVLADEDLQEEEPAVQENPGQTVLRCRNPIPHPEELDRIRACDAVLLVLRAGRRNDTAFERLTEQLGRQDIKVAATVLAAADEKLISAYYRSRA